MMFNLGFYYIGWEFVVKLELLNSHLIREQYYIGWEFVVKLELITFAFFAIEII